VHSGGGQVGRGAADSEYGGGTTDEGKPEPQAAVPPAGPEPGPPPAEPPAPPPAGPPDTGYTSSGVPTFESVREKIETRYGTAIAASELDAESPEGRTVEEQYDARKRAAAERLAEIRESMRGDDNS
jgi:hypothetical protein